jgi:hypothetical protein
MLRLVSNYVARSVADKRVATSNRLGFGKWIFMYSDEVSLSHVVPQ